MWLPGVRTHPREHNQAGRLGQARKPWFFEGWPTVQFRVVSVFRHASQPNHMVSCPWPTKKVRSGYNYKLRSLFAPNSKTLSHKCPHSCKPCGILQHLKGERHTLYLYMEHGKKRSHTQRTQCHLGLENFIHHLWVREGARAQGSLMVSSRGRWCRRGSCKSFH